MRISRRTFLLGVFGWTSIFKWPFKRRTARLASIRFRIVERERSARRYLHIHGNENTAREVLEAHMRANPGVAFFVESRHRHVALEGGALDPNRMWSRVGAEASLRKLNITWKLPQVEAALDRLDMARPPFLKRLLPPAGGLLVALHNNGSGYSVKDEVAISDETALKEDQSPHEFMLCTDAADFALLARSPFNVVLQKNGPKDDDGSLSRLAARRGVRYVNIEAALGNAAKQKEMLNWLESNLP